MKRHLVRSFEIDYPLLTKRARFETGDGWYDLIRDMFAAVDLYLVSNRLGVSSGASFTQIKEKYGTLTAYFDFEPIDDAEYHTGHYNSIARIIDEFEMGSCKVCEDCGVGGSLRHGGWIRTLCGGCSKKK